MPHSRLQRPDEGRVREWLTSAALVGFFVFSWMSVGITRYNGLDSPLFLGTSALCLWRLAGGPLSVAAPLLRAYLLWAGWVVFSDFYSAKFFWAFARDSHWLLLPLLARLCAGALRDAPSAIPLMRVAAAVSVLYIALRLAVAAPGSFTDLREPVFGHIRYLSMAVGVLVVWLYDDAQLGKWARLVVSAGRFAGLVILFWAGGRGAVLALALAFAAHTLLLAPDRKHSIFHLLEFLVAALVSAFLVTDNPSMGLANSVSRTVAPTAADGIFYGRITIWSDTLKRLSEGFGLWFGWGGNGFIRMGLAHGFIFHPHNALLQFLTDWGIIGFALFANFLRVALQALKGAALRTSNGALAMSILAFLLVMGMLDGGLYHPQFLVCAGLALGMLAVPAAKEDSGQVALGLYPAVAILAMTVVHLAML